MIKNLSIVQFNKSEHESTWDEFIAQSTNGTIFHERAFINYHPSDRFNDHSLLFFDKSKLIGIFPAAIIEKNDSKILKSHPGTSYGGIVFNLNLSLSDFTLILNQLEEYSKNLGISTIEFRQAPKIFNHYPIDQFDFALLKSGFIRESEELSTCYYLDDFKNLEEKELLEKFENKTPTKARQGIKKAFANNLEFRELAINEVSNFYSILESNLEKHNTKPVHSKEEIIKLLQTYPGRVKIFGAYKDDKLLAAFLSFNINKLGWHIFYSALDYSQTEYRPVHFLVYSLIKKLSSENIKYLNYGISTEDGGNVINWKLFSFKESFNGHGILRTYWQKHI